MSPVGDERFDVCDDAGRPTGEQKLRALVHRDGDWHRSLHLWVLLAKGPNGRSPDPWLLFQRRSTTKDTWPGFIDVAVTGHFRAGEELEHALRECEEEIGWPVQLGEVTPMGVRFRVDAGRPGVLDREVQHILGTITDRAITSFRADPEEVSALIAVPLSEAVRAWVDRACTSVTAVTFERGALTTTLVCTDAFVAASDGYYATATRAMQGLHAGNAVAPFRIGRP